MTENKEFMELLRELRIELEDADLEQGSVSSPSDEPEEVDEPFWDDRSIERRSLPELFDLFPSDEVDPERFAPSVIEKLDSVIPDKETRAETFQAFFDSLEIAHFESHELLRMGGGNASGPCQGKNRLPAKILWPNVAPTIRALDLVRENLGYAINTTSVYRHSDYNECLRAHSPGVARYSQHLKFGAIDFQGASGTPADWHAAVMDIKGAHPEFGIWTRKYSSFVHIDTRGAS